MKHFLEWFILIVKYCSLAFMPICFLWVFYYPSYLSIIISYLDLFLVIFSFDLLLEME